MRKAIAAALLFLSSWGAHAFDEMQVGFDIVIVAGQSNAVGLGRGPYTLPTAAAAALPLVKQLGRFGADDLQVVPAIDPLQHHVRENAPADEIGFATTFAARIAAAKPSTRTILIIPAARNGSSIRAWDERLEPVQGDRLDNYADMIARANYALSLPGVNRIVAFAWQQGEADMIAAANSTNPWHEPGVSERAASYRYAARLGALFQRVRRDLGDGFPILAGYPVETWSPRDDPTTVSIVTFFKQAIAEAVASDPKASVVGSSGLTSNDALFADGDTIHLNAQSQVDLGSRYFGRWSDLQP